jgi:hypothetical protein
LILAMDYVPALVVFVLAIGALYHFVGRKRKPGEGLVYVLAIAAAFPLVRGGTLAWKELERWQHGRVETGVVVGKLSSTGETGTRTIGGRRFSRASGRRRRVPDILTANGFRLDDVLARVVLTGSRNAYFVEYQHPCHAASACYQREEVRHSTWTQLAVGQTVDVRTVAGQPERARLDFNSPMRIALAKLALGGVLALAAGMLSGKFNLRRRGLVEVPAVITAVEKVATEGRTFWRVRYAYFTADGTACENQDEVYAPGLKTGDNCLAVYPPDRPELGTLRT